MVLKVGSPLRNRVFPVHHGIVVVNHKVILFRDQLRVCIKGLQHHLYIVCIFYKVNDHRVHRAGRQYVKFYILRISVIQRTRVCVDISRRFGKRMHGTKEFFLGSGVVHGEAAVLQAAPGNKVITALVQAGDCHEVLVVKVCTGIRSFGYKSSGNGVEDEHRHGMDLVGECIGILHVIAVAEAYGHFTVTLSGVIHQGITGR